MAQDDVEQSQPMDESAEFVMEFVDDSREDRKPMEDIWDETEMNYLVRPYQDKSSSSNTSNPLDVTKPYAGYAVMKDPETHQEVMTLASKMVLELFPPNRGFVSTKGVGFEDAFKASTAGKLLEYNFRLPGQFWSILQWIVNMGVYGTGILESLWFYEEQPRKFRSVGVDELGNESSTSQILMAPVWDDPRLELRDHRDFFPDPGSPLLSRMRGAASRFRVSEARAEYLAEGKIWRRSKVKKAIDFQTSKDSAELEDKHGDETTGTDMRESMHSFKDMTGYRYCGEVPWTPSDGYTRREIVVLNGETVRDKVWPRRLPWFECKSVPRFNSFWGLAPAEVIRHDQDFADIVKMMLADAVVRMTHPSPVVNKFANVNYEQLRRPRPDRPIDVEGSPDAAIAWPNFNPPLQPAFAMYTETKNQMRQASGALGSIQGLGLGSKRFSATEAAQTFQNALDRPELFATVIEREFLPELGRYNLDLYKENLEPGTDDLSSRIGESSIPVPLSTILSDFDVAFIGSRQLTDQQQIEANREIFSVAANPLVAQMIPWIPLLRDHFKSLGKEEIASMVGNPQLMQLHIALSNMLGPNNAQSGNGNGTSPSMPPSGALPAQIAGGTVGST